MHSIYLKNVTCNIETIILCKRQNIKLYSNVFYDECHNLYLVNFCMRYICTAFASGPAFVDHALIPGLNLSPEPQHSVV